MDLKQAIVFVCEMRGIAFADQHFARRNATGLSMLEGIVQTAFHDADDVLSVVEKGIGGFVNGTQDIVVTDSTDMSMRKWTFIEYESDDLVQVLVGFWRTKPPLANLTRSRPQAYLIPHARADIAAHLKASGLEVERLPYD